MNSKHICRHCGSDTFIMTAHVAQDWLVNNRGEFLECLNNCIEVTHTPNDDDVWACQSCGADDPIVLRENEYPVVIPKVDFERYEKLLQQDTVDYQKEGIAMYSCVCGWTAQIDEFSDDSHKVEVDVKVCSSGWDEPLWTEAVLFDNGSEVCCSEVFDTLKDKWEFDYDGEKIVVVPVFVENPNDQYTKFTSYSFFIPEKEYFEAAKLLACYPLDPDEETRCWKHPIDHAKWVFKINEHISITFFLMSNEAKTVYWIEASGDVADKRGGICAQGFGIGRSLNHIFSFENVDGRSFTITLGVKAEKEKE